MSHLHNRVSALVDGELSPTARRRALAHARRCADCRDEIAGTIEVKQRMARLGDVDVPFDLLELVSATPLVAASMAAAPTPQPRRHRVRRVLIGVGGLSTAMVAAAYVLGSATAAAPTAVIRPPVEEFAAEFADATGVAPFADPAVGGLDSDPSVARRAVPSDSRPDNRGGFAPVAVVTPHGASVPLPFDGADSPQAVLILRRAAAAPDRYAYAGVRTIRCFGPDQVRAFHVQVKHTPGQGTRYDVLRADGRSGPESFVDHPSSAQDELDSTSIASLLTTYDVSVQRTGTADGRPATVLAASRDGHVVARFWIDNASGLLLRKAMYVEGRLVRWSGFTELRLIRHGFMQHLPPELQTPQATALSTAIAPALNDKGWACPDRLTGRYLLTALHQVGTGRAAMHAEYTDGLSTVSVFEERGRLDTRGLSEFRQFAAGDGVRFVRAGLPYIAVWQSGGTVFTVVTDAPQQLTGSVLARLPAPASTTANGVLSRIGDGFATMGDAVTP